MSIPTETPRLFSIRETNDRIRAVLERETIGKPFWIGGIVRQRYLSDLGHEYFNLYDDGYTIPCMIRESCRGSLAFTIANGMELEVLGTVRVYEKKARIEFEVHEVKHVQSILPQLNEAVETELARKGLWPRPKRELPDTIQKIALVTSKHSEAKGDFEDTFRREGGTANVRLCDVRIQGQQAPREIADMIDRLNREGEVDVIVLARGGGRSADLEVFSDYLIAEAICRSRIPVVTGIGHQGDQTFADIAADIPTITPTAAAVRLAKGPELPSPLQSS